jgi:nicotinate-nucleotide adenylyltransferase
MNGISPIGILGGTFDPIHFGHLRLALDLGDALGLALIHFLPAGQPWQRLPAVSPAVHRLEMVRLAIADNARFVLDSREIVRNKPTYTVDTLTELRGELGSELPIWLLLGADAFVNLPTWHRWNELFGLAHVAIAQRRGHRLEPHAMPAGLAVQWRLRLADEPGAANRQPGGRIIAAEMTGLDISATRIREMLREHKSPRYLLPDAVLDYIESNQLYT